MFRATKVRASGTNVTISGTNVAIRRTEVGIRGTQVEEDVDLFLVPATKAKIPNTEHRFPLLVPHTVKLNYAYSSLLLLVGPGSQGLKVESVLLPLSSVTGNKAEFKIP